MTTRKRKPAPQDIFQIHAGYCGMFSNPARLRLVWTLGSGERTVTSLARQLKLSVSTCSRHLAKLRDKGVVVARRQGAHLYYRVASPCFLEGCRGIRRGIIEVLRRSRQAFGAGYDS
ncbi:MAG: winged helix-turn-helix transcriptional regulator [Deltaproteobacteria bacterium]|nr:winged helix-turn-helix transcriptional regulator [Deltaproteobacteria bacterium]